MSVFSKVRDFFSRHRNKFIIGSVLITGSVFLSRYAQKGIKQWQEREAAAFFERTRKQQHFESINRTCNQTTINLLAALNNCIAKCIDTEEVVNALQCNPENRLKLWNDLKVLVFTKVGVLVYSSVMLVVTLRIQLSIIGGYLYKDPNSISTDLQEHYLCLCQNLLNAGIMNISIMMKKECAKVLEAVELQKQLKLSDLETIFWTIQTAVAALPDNPIDCLKKYIIPDDTPTSNGVYGSILQDTADFLESDEVKSLVTHGINRGFILLGDLLSEYYCANGSQVTEVASNTVNVHFSNPFDSKKAMAKLLPIINGLFTKKSFPDKLAQLLISNDKVINLGANVYECLL